MTYRQLLGKVFTIKAPVVLNAWNHAGKEVTLRNGEWLIEDYTSDNYGTSYTICLNQPHLYDTGLPDEAWYTVDPYEMMRVADPEQFEKLQNAEKWADEQEAKEQHA